jgi:glutamyl-tRNA reductase
VTRFLAESRAHDAGPAIRALRAQAEAVRQQTLAQAQRMLAGGKTAEEALEYLAATLTNRLMHTPTQALRHAAELADAELAETVVRLLTEERDRP